MIHRHRPHTFSRQAQTGSADAFLRFALRYWSTGSSSRAWLLAASCLLLLFANLAINVGLNRWHRWFFDMLEQKDPAALLPALVALLVLVVGGAAAAVATLYASMTLQLDWRKWMTNDLIQRWTANAPAGPLYVAGENHGSPEFRLVEDVRLAIEPVVNLAIGFANAVLLGATFAGVLIAVGGSIKISIFGVGMEIPGFLAISAVAYAALLSIWLYLIGQPLIHHVADKNEAESQFLFALTATVEREAVTESNAARHSTFDSAAAAFAVVVHEWRRVIRERCRLTWLTNSHSFFSPVLPLLLAAPKYVTGELSLGAVMQIATAFVVVLGALNWLTDNYVHFAEWSASARRVDELRGALDNAAHQDRPAPSTSPT